MDATGNLNIWTDGACTKNGKVGARGGCGVYIPAFDVRMSIDIPGDVVATNNVAELMAIGYALDWVVEQKLELGAVCIYTDSSYSIGALTKWRSGWEANHMKTSAGGNVKNAELIIKLWKKIDAISNIKFIHVSAHQNPKTATYEELNNIIVDQLANRGLALPEPPA